MTAKRDKQPAPIFQKVYGGRVIPATAADDEIVDADPIGTEYDLVRRTKRSWPQLRLYWMVLNGVVKAHGGWPNAEKLHTDLKWCLGYTERTINPFTGEERIEVDSAALDKMDEPTFCAFMDQAMEFLSDKLGFDPFDALPKKKAAA